ncbi:hypothetical protein [Agromyces ramosus]|uniref:Uncharacterized protein n=1 Tax=Agromyces ramosus TaxID=33879 RepID=A0ABU0R7W9_9MICO|nr:hypothetical protein [Agromyces ramosus]MDQ0894186.1 hypothetical protein [Agromyces ramosus]
MQFSADFVAMHSHEADVLRAERELGLRAESRERGSGGEGPSPEPVTRRHHRGHRALRLALR